MGFVDSVKKCFSHFTDFTDRASRSEFWWFTLFAVVVQAVLSSLVVALGNALLQIIVLIPIAIIIITSLSVGARRLHDRNMSGWWQLISIIPFGTFVLIVLWALPGTAGANDYGEEP